MTEFANLTVAKYGAERILEEQCFDGGCYVIKDALINPLLSIPYERKLVDKTTNQLKACAVLSMPKNRVKSKMDSRQWFIKRERFEKNSLDYAIMEAAILSGAIPLDTLASVDILVVGIGSGSIANFINHYYKRSNISMLELEKKMAVFLITWFQIVPSQRLQIILGDELEQIHKLSDEEEAKFRVVFFNMCPHTSRQTCPDENTLPDQAIRSIVELVGDKGVFIISLTTDVNDRTSVYEKQKNRLEQHFNECVLFKPKHVYNQVLSCTQGNHNFDLEAAAKNFIQPKDKRAWD